MPVPRSPTVRRRRLGAELRKVREDLGILGEEVATALGWSPAKVSRYELARTGLKPLDVEKLLDFYEIIGSQRAQLLGLAHDAAQKGWWEELSDAVPADLQQFIGLENEASSIAIWHIEVVPGLLQTEAYAAHVIGGYSAVEPIAPAMVERRVRIRMQRQEILTRDPPPKLEVVLDESILHRRVGGSAIMHEQLLRLAEDSERPNIDLRVLPLSGQHTVFGANIVIFTFGPGPDAILHDVVSAEGLRSDFYVDGEQETHLHSLGFRAFHGAALDPAASRQLILDTAVSRWSGAEGVSQ